MSNINIQSILDKAKQYTDSDEFQLKIQQKTDDILIGSGSKNTSKGKRITISGINRAADKFIEVLKNEINSHSGRGLGDTAISALTKLQHGKPYKIGKNQYQIEVWFSENLYRDSLAPDYFDEGIQNVAALLNKGYSARNTIYGIWYGSNHGYASSFNIPSLREREGLHFIENAIKNYTANYSKEYGIINIYINDIYELN